MAASDRVRNLRIFLRVYKRDKHWDDKDSICAAKFNLESNITPRIETSLLTGITDPRTLIEVGRTVLLFDKSMQLVFAVFKERPLSKYHASKALVSVEACCKDSEREGCEINSVVSSATE